MSIPISQFITPPPPPPYASNKYFHSDYHYHSQLTIKTLSMSVPILKIIKLGKPSAVVERSQ